MAKLQKSGIYVSLFAFVAVAVYLFTRGCFHHLLLGVGATFVLYSTTEGDLVGSIMAGAVIAFAMTFFKKKMEGFEDAPEEEPVETEKKEKPKKAVPPPPDHGDRAEMFELGKKYKLPSEKEDKDFHLDAGTTFMNAYKSLKPDQIQAMTKDTQELMETQKQLMNTLQTLKPLISDGKQMMEMFQSYFGSGTPTST
jgi:hypothetical protein